MINIVIFLSFIIYLYSCNAPNGIYIPEEEKSAVSRPESDIIDGLTMVSSPDSFITDPMNFVVDLNAEWIALVPFAFFVKNEAKIYDNEQNKWWGETSQGIKKSVSLARNNNLKIMLKPQLWTYNQWIGDLDFENEKDWLVFEESYSLFILKWLNVAIEYDVELFCFGTELRKLVQKRSSFIYQLIKIIRERYNGKLVYASNWDNYINIEFWTELDYIGINAYFPLDDTKTPEPEILENKWKPYYDKMKIISGKFKKKIIFTEYGYLSVDGCAGKTWELENNKNKLSKNEIAQMNAIKALHKTFRKSDFWAGGFLWKWYPDSSSMAGEGKIENDYTPQGKLSEKALKKLFK